MSSADYLALLIPAGFVIGSVPFGLLVARVKGIDPREHGSGNIGATNIGRLLGRKFFVLVFILDALKGLVPMGAAGRVVHSMGQPPDSRIYLLWLATGLAAVLGHMFSPVLKFKGGKGVATSFGMALGAYPYFTVPALIAFGVWALVLAGMRYVSLASITAAVAFLAIYIAIGQMRGWEPFGRQWPMLAFAALIVAMIVLRHRTNIGRLLSGTESRIGASAKKAGTDGDG